MADIVWDDEIKWDEPPKNKRSSAGILRMASPITLMASMATKDGRQDIGDLAAGGLRGAGSIGATILTPYDMAVGNTKSIGNPERRQAMDDGLQTMGADPESTLYKAGKLGTEIAGTAGVGGALGAGAKAVGASAPIVNSLASAGFRTGAPLASIFSKAGGANALTRIGGGAASGGASAGLVDPEYAQTGAGLGAFLPGASKFVGMMGGKLADLFSGGANRMMQSAIKPNIKDLQNGNASIAIQTLLEKGINPTEAGVGKLRTLIDGLNNDIRQKIAGSSASIDKNQVLSALGGTRTKFGNQVSPTSDLEAIQRVADDFTAHPNYPGQTLPIQAAQDLKQGTYKVLSKKYGQLGNAETEAQKGLARGLKDEIAKAVPEIQGLNAEESRLITTLKVAERRALMEMNKNPVGLATFAQSPAKFALFMADKSALFKSLAARMVNSSVQGAQKIAPSMGSPTNQALARSAPVAVLSGE